MKRAVQATCALVATMALSAQPALAQLFSPDIDEQQWSEQQAQLPAFPKPENLIEINVPVAASFWFGIDGTSVDVGKDGVIRYVLVARSSSGSENISFEGLRCDTRERKLYAVGRADRTWVRARNSSWVRFAGNTGSYHFVIAREYFCPSDGKVQSAGEAVRNLKSGIAAQPLGVP